MLDRVPAGRLNGIHAEEGTILGPTWTRELVVVTGNDEQGMTLGYLNQSDAERSTEDPKSVPEFRKNQLAQRVQCLSLMTLFGGKL